ncbi:MAG: helix-turn-helix domain-containing protein [Spongiibacteraceae bacterium]|nr:helix-turn-helix domain-containing protein [Spongiibacteraceae bacterium]
MSYYGDWKPYVSVAQQRAQARREMDKLRKKGFDVCPVEIVGQKITRTFWGDAWCDHLESFSDYENRLPRGKRYVRNGSVCHLAIEEGKLEAIVSGSELYDVEVVIKPLAKSRWKVVKQLCAGQIGSVLELLEGRLSDSVMAVVTDAKTGLFPSSKDIQLSCDCPDWAVLCKHLAAVLYGVGALLDKQPELLFKLRGVDHESLVSTNIVIPSGTSKRRRITSDVGNVFGIELDGEGSVGLDTSNKKSPGKRRSGVTKKVKKSSAVQVTLNKPVRKKIVNPTSVSVSRLRKRLGMSVGELALLIGVSRSSIGVWENQGGRLNLRDQSKQALMLVFDLDKDAAWEKLSKQ